ncbi:MAG TPA: hypothetical protein VNO30_48055 [Kofleriaceae bacterium]|nr:hypothetical protein [Kofleriaceae bacterium]
MLRACGFAVAASFASITGGSEARAEQDRVEEVVELRYTAPPGCPTRDATVELIRERTAAVRFAPGARRVFEIRITAGEQGYTGALIVDAAADKQLAAQRCDDLVTALALVLALAIDPAAAAGPRDPPAAAAGGATGGAAAAGPPDPATAVAAAGPPGPATAVAAADPPGPAGAVAAAMARPRRRVVLDGAIGGLVGAGLTPDPLLAGSLAARATWRAVAAELALVAGRDTTVAADGRASFLWITARPAACQLWRRGGLELGGCGHVELGLVRAAGEDIVNARSLYRLWAAAGAHGSLRWSATGRRGFAQLQLGAAVPITRDRYWFKPGIILHETPPVTAWLGLGVGLRFP